MSTQKTNLDSRNTLVEKHYDLVPRIARSIHRNLPPSFELDDLIQSGVLGLIQAAERFDPSVDFGFETFARHRVRGAIIDSIRRKEYVENTCQELPENIQAEQPDIVEQIAARQEAAQVNAAMEDLPAREQKIIAMRYAHGVALATIGTALHISKTRTVQLHRRALGHMRMKLAQAA